MIEMIQQRISELEHERDMFVFEAEKRMAMYAAVLSELRKFLPPQPRIPQENPDDFVLNSTD